MLHTERRHSSNGILWITLDHPPLNTLSTSLRDPLFRILDGAHSDPSLRTVVITGDHEAFSAGADLAEVASLETEAAARHFFSSFETLFSSLTSLPVPVIAAVPGPATGGGLELALRCDLIYACRDAVFAASGVNIGLIESAGTLPQRVSDRYARDLLFTGRQIDAQAAERMGLINGCVDGETLDDTVMTVARRIASRPPLSVRAIKDILNRTPATKDADLDPSETRIADDRLKLWSTADHTEAVEAFFDKRTPDFRGE